MEIRNLNIFFKINILKKVFKGKLLLKEKKLKTDCNAEEITKDDEPRISLEIIKNIVEVLELKRINFNILVGALFMIPTVISTALISSLIPHIYHLPFKKKGKLSFVVLPAYDRLIFKASVKGEFKVTIYNLLLILILLRRFKLLSFINSQLHNQK